MITSDVLYAEIYRWPRGHSYSIKFSYPVDIHRKLHQLNLFDCSIITTSQLLSFILLSGLLTHRTITDPNAVRTSFAALIAESEKKK